MTTTYTPPSMCNSCGRRHRPGGCAPRGASFIGRTAAPTPAPRPATTTHACGACGAPIGDYDSVFCRPCDGE